MNSFYLLIIITIDMKKISIWNDFKDNLHCQKIDHDMNVDVLIIGGGIAGISTLYEMKKTNLNVVLVERDICGRGVTSRSTAKATFLQESILMKIRDFVGNKEAKEYLESQITAVKMLKDIIDTEHIDCDLKEVYSYLFTNDEKNIKKLEEEEEFLKKNNINVVNVRSIPFNIPMKRALKVSNTYVIHPLKYIHYMKEKYYDFIYEYSKVDSINKENDYYICEVNKNIIKAKYVVIASHYPYFLFPFLMPLKTHVETSFVGAIKTKDYKNISAINIDKPTISFRYHNDGANNYLIYLFESCMSCNVKNISDYFQNLNKQYDFEYLWSNKDIITNDYMPYIGRIHKNDNTLLMASGFNTWGITNGILAGKLLTDIIKNKKNPYEKLLDPNRKINLSKIIRFPIDVGSSIKALIKSTKRNVNNTKVIYKKINGDNVAVFIDENNKEHIVKNRCPHMKCGLVFNEVERTWDCLCHGSRFDIDGNCIEGPSNYNIAYKKRD